MMLKKHAHARITADTDERCNMPVTFMFDPNMPIEVNLTFHENGMYDDNDDDDDDDDDRGITWVFSRELLHQGLNMPAGMNDVIVWPTDNYLVIQLTGADVCTGHIHSIKCEFHYSSIMEFLTASYTLVSHEDEDKYVNVDNIINGLLQRNDNGESVS